MANYCNYEVRVKGSKKTCLMVYESMPCADYKDIEWEKGSGSSTVICFTGDCKWSVNYGVTDSLKRVTVNSMTESQIEAKGPDYWGYSLRAKSEAFQCEIMVHYWSSESGFDQFDHYKNGKILKQRKIAFNYDVQNVFDWDKLEFVGHEGEYDDSVDGEEQDAMFMSKLLGFAAGADNDEEYDDADEDQDELFAMYNRLGELMDKLDRFAADAGIDMYTAPIGETGFDLYDWTFTQGKTVKGEGWTIAIPDGFVQVKSNDGKNRLFELVPVTYKDETDVNKIPVRILPGDALPGSRLGENWMVHPEARAGIAGIYGVMAAQFASRIMGQAPELFTVAWADVAAHIVFSNLSYSYQCTVMTDNQNWMLRIQTQSVLEKQKQLLDASVQAWLKTMRFDKPSHAFARCFSCSTVESIAMWMLYSGDKGKNGAMLSFPNAMMHELVNSAEIELGSFVNKQFVCSKVLTRENGDYSIILSDVVYTDDNKDGKTTTLTLWEDHENVDKSILNSQAVFHKNYAWAYEKECRLIVHLSAGMEQLAAENGLNRVRIILPRRYLNILRKKYFVRSPVYEGYVDIGRPSELAGKVEWDL